MSGYNTGAPSGTGSCATCGRSKVHLTWAGVITAAHARPGEVVTLTASGLPRNRLVILQSWGPLGTVSDGHFAASYYLAAAPAGRRRAHSIKAEIPCLPRRDRVSQPAFRY